MHEWHAPSLFVIVAALTHSCHAGGWKQEAVGFLSQCSCLVHVLMLGLMPFQTAVLFLCCGKKTSAIYEAAWSTIALLSSEGL